MRALTLTLLSCVLLAACGGGNPPTAPAALSGIVRHGAPLQAEPTPTVFPGLRSSYKIIAANPGYFVIDSLGNISAVGAQARLRFDDLTVAFDIEGNAGQIYRLYQAAFNRVPDAAGLGFWLQQRDHGASLLDIAAAFVASAEFQALYGAAPSDADLVNLYYQHVLHRTGDSGGLQFWLGLLESKAANAAGVLVGFSDSAESLSANLAALAGGINVIEADIAYLPRADAGPATRNASLGSSLTLDGSASTASLGRHLSYYWNITAKPGGSKAGLLRPTSARPAFVPDLPGGYEVQLLVNDGQVYSATATIKITCS